MEGYIEKKAALDLIESATAWRMSTNQLYDEMNGLPAADVAPVVHAWWLFDAEWWENKCTYCGGRAVKEHKYCPNCGAKMDLEG